VPDLASATGREGEEVMATGAIHIQRLQEAGFDPWRVAVHEAGHAVVAWALDVPVKQIELGTFKQTPDGKLAGGGVVTCAGYTTLIEIWRALGRGHRTMRHALTAVAMMMLAGQAERQLVGDDEGAYLDDQYVEEVIDALDGFPTDEVIAVVGYGKHMNRLWWMTRVLVKHHTEAITRLANVLMKEGVLDFDRTYAIVSGRMT
jgi:hypothetical protein